MQPLHRQAKGSRSPTLAHLLVGGWALLLGLALSACSSVAPAPTPSGFAPCVPSPSTQARPLALPQGLGDFLAPHVPGELLALSGGIAPQTLAARVGGIQLQDRLAEGFLRLRVPVGQEWAKAEALRTAGARWVQPNYLYFPLYQPNDPLYPASLADPYRLRPFYQEIHLESAWDSVGTPRCTPVVAVLDTAFNPAHPDLQANLLAGKNLTPDGLGPDDLSPAPPPQGSSYLQGEADHGEGVAGLVAAAANNGRGIPGVGLNYARVLPIKVFYWVGTSYSVSSDVLANAIRYAADQKAAVINLSLGSPTPLDPAVQQALDYALSKGALPVAASGNDGADGLDYPAAYPGVLAAGAARLDGGRADFSNYSSQPKYLVLAAAGNKSPQQLLYSLAIGQNYPYYQSLGNYAAWAGTSFAAPQVSGVAALYVAKFAARYGQGPTPDQTRRCLTQTASNGGAYDAQTGYGLLQADRVLTDTTVCFPN
ncbi:MULTISPECIES: S8 family serine peptidase [unclassified Meiothermus]|uniref:S8 family peptidase n=1 Tax=unclassified Meiothermus TaxID=370471 RepID=UPI000D7C3A3E|nr:MULTISPECIES: S8 family serine peptidase [unclassified Meiothermus]PZA06330.1 peptidase S8 [Meiothermus sp. Pnk-1]RYM35204.1 peptidase S8 [Meiothermus sp. PNK-Is4]